MRTLYFCGWGFLALAFIAAAFESAAGPRFGHTTGFIMSAHQMLEAYWPLALSDARSFVEDSLHRALWDPLLVTLLALPGWALLGVPGIVLVLRYRPRRVVPKEEQMDEDSLFVFDALAKRARDEGYVDSDDDGYTEDRMNDNYDPAGLTASASPEDYVEDWEPPGPGDRAGPDKG